jgi:hypothetical protein
MILGKDVARFACCVRALVIALYCSRLSSQLAGVQIFDNLLWVVHVRVHANRTG